VGELAPADAGVVPETPGGVNDAVPWYVRERPVLAALVDGAGAAGLDRDAVTILLDSRMVSAAVNTARDALSYALTALAAARRLGDPILEAEAEREVGGKYAQLHELDLADRHLGRALDLFLSLGDATGEAHTLRTLGYAAILREQADRAIDLYLQSVQAARRASTAVLAAALADLGWAFARFGRYRDAIEPTEDALRIAREDGIPYLEPIVLPTLAVARAKTGSAEQAVGLFEEALSLLRAHGNRSGELDVLADDGDALSELGDPGGARRVWTGYLRLVEVTDTQESVSDLAVSGRTRQAEVTSGPVLSTALRTTVRSRRSTSPKSTGCIAP